MAGNMTKFKFSPVKRCFKRTLPYQPWPIQQTHSFEVKPTCNWVPYWTHNIKKAAQLWIFAEGGGLTWIQSFLRTFQRTCFIWGWGKKFLKHVQRYRGRGEGGAAKIQSWAAFLILWLPNIAPNTDYRITPYLSEPAFSLLIVSRRGTEPF